MRVGLIGYGGIGQTVAKAVAESQDEPETTEIIALVRPNRIDKLRRSEARSVQFVDSLEALIEREPEVVAECAGHSAVHDAGVEILRHGIDLIVISAGALADDVLRDSLIEAARAGNSTIRVPSGALAGIDALATVASATDLTVRYIGCKPPSAWRGTPAEEVVSLGELEEEACFFVGNARDAALQYPKNSNVAAIVALAGVGFEETNVSLVADPSLKVNQHTIEISSSICEMRACISSATLAENPRTSALAAQSVAKSLMDRCSALVL